MNTPNPHAKEARKIRRLIGSLIIAGGATIFLSQFLAESHPPTVQDGNYLRMKMPIDSPPSRLIET